MGKHNFRLAVNLVVTQDSKVLLMRRYNTGWNDGMYALMGGHVEDGENIFDAAVREAKEELGILVKTEELKPLFSMQVSSDHVYFYFGCDKYEGTPTNMEPDQCDDLSFFNTDCLPDNLIAADKKALEMIFGTQEKSFDTFGWGK